MEPALAPLIIGGIFFLVGIALLWKQLKAKMKCTATVSGEVVEYQEEVHHSSHSHGRELVYYPIFTYYYNGQWHRQKGSMGRGRQQYEIGQHVELRCNPEDPDTFIVVGDKAVILVPVVCALMGLVVMILAFVG